MTKRLTKAEEEIMIVLWKLKEATVRDIMKELEVTDTPYTTISTMVRVLEKKGFADHRAIGTTHLYYPRIEKQAYLRGQLSGIAANYFNGSVGRMAAFFARENDLDLKELSDIMNDIDQELKEENKS